MKDFKDLEVFVQARLLVKEVYSITSTFPKEEVYGITNQIRRSSVSILSNIAEGMGGNTKLIQFNSYLYQEDHYMNLKLRF